MIHTLAIHLNGMAPVLSVFLQPATTNTLKDAIQKIADNALTVMAVLIPVLAIFRLVYRFADSKEGSLMVLMAEVVLIIFVAIALRTLLGTIVKGL